MKISNTPFSHQRLHRLSQRHGSFYETENFSVFLYSIIKMEKPKHVLELGTGLGITSLWLAQALKENAEGHLWSVDDGSHYRKFADVKKRVRQIQKDFPQLLSDNYPDFLQSLKKEFSLQKQVSFLHHDIFSFDPKKIASASTKIDLLFSDFNHSIQWIDRVIEFYLPRMTVGGSIFFDNVPSRLSSLIHLRSCLQQINEQKLPPTIQRLSVAKQRTWFRQMKKVRLQLIYMNEKKKKGLYSRAWIRILPRNTVDLDPQWLKKL